MDRARVDHDAPCALIRNAFGEFPLGKGISWREADEIDNSADANERARARESDDKSDWMDVAPELFDERPSAVTFLDSTGFFFYLPAFIIADLKRDGRWESAVEDQVQGRILQDREAQRRLSPEQRKCVNDWLAQVAARYPWADYPCALPETND